MSSNVDDQEHNPVENLHMQPAKGILKSAKSIDDPGQNVDHEATTLSVNNCPTTGMTRSESKSHKIPHFDEMNIIATYHPPNKDYGHMKIEEPKTPYAPNDMIDEEMDSEHHDNGATTTGVDPNTLAQRLNDSKVPSSNSTQSHTDHAARRSIDEGVEHSSEDLEHRKQFQTHRKQHYNEFEVVRLRKKEIEAELRALEQEEANESGSDDIGAGKGTGTVSSSRSSIDSIKPILVHHSRDSSSSSSHHHHHVQVEADDDADEEKLNPEERERKKQFELKRKKHYNEFRAARLADKEDDQETTG